MKGDEWKNPNPIRVCGRVFSPKAQRWIRQSLKRRVGIATGFSDGTLDKALIEPLQEWYCERWTQFVDWKPYAEFATGLRDGRWIFCETDFVDEWKNAHAAAVKFLKEQEAAKAARSFTSLDAWLAADLKKQITASPRGGKLQSTLSDQIFLAAVKRRNRWPRNCTACGSSFTHDKRSTKRCDGCRSTKAVKQSEVRRVIAQPTAQKLLPASTQPKHDTSDAFYRGQLEQQLKQTNKMIEDMMKLDEELRCRPGFAGLLEELKLRQQEGEK